MAPALLRGPKVHWVAPALRAPEYSCALTHFETEIAVELNVMLEDLLKIWVTAIRSD